MKGKENKQGLKVKLENVQKPIFDDGTVAFYVEKKFYRSIIFWFGVLALIIAIIAWAYKW